MIIESNPLILFFHLPPRVLEFIIDTNDVINMLLELVLQFMIGGLLFIVFFGALVGMIMAIVHQTKKVVRSIVEYSTFLAIDEEDTHEHIRASNMKHAHELLIQRYPDKKFVRVFYLKTKRTHDNSKRYDDQEQRNDNK